MTITRTKPAGQQQGQDIAPPQQQVAVFQPPRLPYHKAIEERFGVDPSLWKALVEAVYPSAATVDVIVMALSYCKARKLDPFKKPIHIVPMWSSQKGAMIETVWPGISELRTTAFRTGNFAGMDEAEFGPDMEYVLAGKAGRGKMKGEERSVTMHVPEWCRITVWRLLGGQRHRFVGPKVYWLEAYARWIDTDVPNDMWEKRGVGQLEKCAEAAALRRAFPEELGNDLTAEEMEGRVFDEAAPHVQEARELVAKIGAPEGLPPLPSITPLPQGALALPQGALALPPLPSSDNLDIPPGLRRTKPTTAPAAQPASPTYPDPADQPEEYYKFIAEKLRGAKSEAEANMVWVDFVQPHLDGEGDRDAPKILPPDLESINGLFDTCNEKLRNGE
jgi:phage recombination protein Bet